MNSVRKGTYGDVIVFAYTGIIGFDLEDYDSYSQHS